MSRTSNPTEPPDDDDELGKLELLELAKDFIDHLYAMGMTLNDVMKPKGIRIFREFRDIWDMSEDEE